MAAHDDVHRRAAARPVGLPSSEVRGRRRRTGSARRSCTSRCSTAAPRRAAASTPDTGRRRSRNRRGRKEVSCVGAGHCSLPFDINSVNATANPSSLGALPVAPAGMTTSPTRFEIGPREVRRYAAAQRRQVQHLAGATRRRPPPRCRSGATVEFSRSSSTFVASENPAEKSRCRGFHPRTPHVM